MIKYIHVWYFSRLLFDADHESEVLFCFIPIYIPDFCSPTNLASRFGLKYLSLTDIKQSG